MCLRRAITSFPLEPEVLERLCGAPIELRGHLVLTAPRRQVALCDPRRRAVADGGKLVEAPLGGVEGLFGLFEPILLEKRATEHELGIADLVDHVDAIAEELQGLARLLFGALDLARPQVNLRERRDGAGRVGLAAVLEEHLERLVQLLDRLLGLAEGEVDPAEVVQDAPDGRAVRDLLELRLRLLGVLAGENPLPLALGDERRLEVDTRDGAGVVETFRELERALEILARGLEVALTPVAARAQPQDLGPKAVAGKLRPLGERQRLVEEADRRLDARQLDAAGAEPEKNVGAVDVGEHRLLRQRASPVQELDRRLDLTGTHLHPRLP